MKKRKNSKNNLKEIDLDCYFMDKALKEAKKAYQKDEVPVGAILVSKEGEILARAHNTSEHGKSALAHAEIKVLEKASSKLKQTRLWDSTIYVSLEPCPMCATAISMMRVKRVVFGAENPKGGAILNGIKIYENQPNLYKPEITPFVLKEEASTLLTEFFKTKRQKDKN